MPHRPSPTTAVAAALALVLAGACGGGSGNGDAGAAGCTEFPSGLAALQGNVDADTLDALQAAADLLGAAQSLESGAYAACAAIDTDLAVPDTWSARSTLDDQLAEACSQATARIKAVLAAATPGACELAISSGRCVVDPTRQATCEMSCNGASSCSLLGVALRCAPAQLSGECDAQCADGSVCEGTPALEAPCDGSCEGDCAGVCNTTMQTPTVRCEGKCEGNCTGTCDGKPQVAAGCGGKCSGTCDAPCDDTMAGGTKAHCDGQCVGKCTGGCTVGVQGGIACGAMASCRGGCGLPVKNPQCEGKLAAPACMIEAACESSCQGDAELLAKCTTPAAALECDGTPAADLAKLVATVGKNLPALLLSGRTQGALLADAATQIAAAAQTLAQNQKGTLSGKALACVQAASDATSPVPGSVSGAVQASAAVDSAAGAPM